MVHEASVHLGVCQGDVHFDTRSLADRMLSPSTAAHSQDERFSACVKVYVPLTHPSDVVRTPVFGDGPPYPKLLIPRINL